MDNKTKKEAEALVAKNREQLMADLRTVVQDAQKVLTDTKNDSMEAVTEKVSLAQDKLKNSLDRVMAYEEMAVDHATEYVDKTEKLIHKHPWQTVALAATVGLICGRLWNRE